MKKPEMIGAHVPRKPGKRPHRWPLTEAREAVDRAFDDWVRKPGRTQHARVITPMGPRGGGRA